MTSRILLLIAFLCSLAQAQIGLGVGVGVGVGIPIQVGVPSINLMIGTGINANGNASISAAGTYAVYLTQNLVLSTLIVGGPGSTPIFNVGAGVNLNVSQLSLLGGVINVAAGASLNVQAITVNANPVTINIGVGSTLTVGAININAVSVTGVLLNNALTISGAGTLSLIGATVNIAGSNLAINVPVVIGATTAINTAGSAAVVFGSLVTVTSSANLNANIIVNNLATVVLSNVPGINLRVLSANFVAGSTLVITINGVTSNILNVAGNLVSQATLVLNGLTTVAAGISIPIITFGTLTGGFTLAANTGFSIGATANAILAIRV